MSKNFFEEDEFIEFSMKHHKDIDDTIFSMYQQWKLFTSDNKVIEFFNQPTAVAEEGPPEDFNVELLEKVNGAGFIKVQDPDTKNMKEIFVWRLLDDGTIQVALKSTEQIEPLKKDVLEACTEMVTQHYAGEPVEVTPTMRDHFFNMYTGITYEQEQEKEEE